MTKGPKIDSCGLPEKAEKKNKIKYILTLPLFRIKVYKISMLYNKSHLWIYQLKGSLFTVTLINYTSSTKENKKIKTIKGNYILVRIDQVLVKYWLALKKIGKFT